jgi:hypothetical protein
MSHIWTIIFVILFALAFGIMSWQEREEKKRRQRRAELYTKRDETRD